MLQFYKALINIRKETMTFSCLNAVEVKGREKTKTVAVKRWLDNSSSVMSVFNLNKNTVQTTISLSADGGQWEKFFDTDDTRRCSPETTSPEVLDSVKQAVFTGLSI
ncbi:MAG: DUF3459 domain-containing protein [Nitrospirota bacterium]